ncbi:hypothetical protein GEV33_001746 [Tenebrio molitor]|uniref:Uncharacterized protein n=1 Tax=Tenebrio molitor TaxID=7067 RepID=A0A8J6LGK6_TENMO|nr:hypothetical protein GEV33_001746 [Tenebrio molitor]
MKKKVKIEKAVPKKDERKVSYFQLFRYATLQDKFFIALGTICSVVCGVIQPYVMILFGDVTGVIVEYAAAVNKTNDPNEIQLIEDTLYDGIVMALVLGWKLALVCLVSLPVSFGVTMIVSWLSSKFSRQEMEAYGAAGSIAEEVLSSIRTVVAFDGQNKEITRYEKHLQSAKKNNITKSLFSGISNGFMWFFLFASYALSFWYGVGLILEEKYLPEDQIIYTPANMVSVFFCTLIASFNFGTGAPYFEIFGTACGAAAKVFEILDTEPQINLYKNLGTKPKTMRGDISFKNVHFQYPSRPDVKILQGFNLDIKSGETVALVGSSGCGKSTCIQLIQRFYDAVSGSVTIDDNNITKLNLTWLRNKIGVVGQEPALFAATIADNIKYGNVSATQDDIEKAAKKANAHNFIKSLPRGYNTLIGERGAQISGGQKQRIAIARALIREPKILLLDEATSALDTTSEAEVQAALDAISGECTTIIVAHRLSTIRNADRIVVVSEGKVIEEGNHAQLMAQKGAYHSLVVSQGLSETEDVFTEDKEVSSGVKNVAKVSETAMIESTSEENLMHLFAIAGEKLTKRMRGNMFRALLSQEMAWFDRKDNGVGALCAKLSGEAASVQGDLQHKMLGVLQIGHADKLPAKNGKSNLLRKYIDCCFFKILSCHSVYLSHAILSRRSFVAALFCRGALLSLRSLVAALILRLSFVACSNVVDSLREQMYSYIVDFEKISLNRQCITLRS